MVLERPTLRGTHVRLEPLAAAHAPELWEAASEHEIWAYMTTDVRTPDDLQAWVASRIKAMDAGDSLVFVQRDAVTGAAFGSTSIYGLDLRHRTMAVGYTWIARGHRRTAANSEAKRLVLGHCFEALGAYRVELRTDLRNERSQRAIERLGAVREGVCRNQMVLPDGSKRNAVIYSITDDEWPAVRDRLDGFLAARQ